MLAKLDLSPLALSALVGLAGVAAIYLLLAQWTRSKTNFDGPPGMLPAALVFFPIPDMIPSGYPILGNWNIIGKHHLWNLLEEWSKIYG